MILPAMVLVWSVTTCAADGPARTFRFERAPLPLTTTRPEPPLVWQSYDSYDAALCVSGATRRGCYRTECQRPDPDRMSAFRVSACNGAVCSAAAETARLSCADLSATDQGCPCVKLAAPAGCVP